MYSTLRFRIKTSQETKKLLLIYETIYHQEIGNLLNQLHHGIYKFKNMKFDSNVCPNMHWFLYKQALKKLHAEQNNKEYHYSRSSSWIKGTYMLKSDVLLLFFGCSFPIEALSLNLVMNEQELMQLQNGEIIRIDLVHDERFWFANFIVKYSKE